MRLIGDGKILVLVLLATNCVTHILYEGPTFGLSTSTSVSCDDCSIRKIVPANTRQPEAVTQINFFPWGNDNNMKLAVLSTNASPFYILKGSTGAGTAGFYSPSLNYKGNYLSLTLGNVNKTGSPSHSQVSFVFEIQGMKDEYRLSFVHGPLSILGWRNNTYYENINDDSTRIVNLEDLLSFNNDSYSHIEEAFILVQEQITLNPLEFKIRLSPVIDDLPSSNEDELRNPRAIRGI